MLKISKNQNENGYYFIITTDEGQFEISYEGNLDLYWRNIYRGNILEQPESKSFTITKENYYLYSLFTEVYKSIKNCNVFKIDETDICRCESAEDIKEVYRIKRELNNKLKKVKSIILIDFLKTE